ncbi:Zn-dependent hydrolase [Natrarchaeobius chitinivorans]|uniref:Zn-dependent hydrolase n=1 Tax=Natrarchaeobius chitinivorans TaxID=1679083 RepID=A0A3N6PBA3_NATCH|nr:Zn-dependent hydrolase [Natrarchaeobius chitinivorans]RQG96519.1 Zn-dependent hydrolase [Natrarchaeobius chitinivorans]
MDIQLDEHRLRSTFERYSEIGGTEDGGLHRLALSDADKKTRDTLISDLEAVNASVRIDRVGNIFGRREGTDPDADPILIGSHLDSQPYGGRYDGQLGVIAALETLRTFEEEGIETRHPIELVNWTNEEGARFDLAPLGVGVFTGKYSLDEALSSTDDNGTTVKEELERIEYDGTEPCEPFDIDSYLELHIEQGPELERRGTNVGIVTGIVGLSWLNATFQGEADHAGTTPMYDRKDAMVAASRGIGNANTIPAKLPSDTVITAGEVTVQPNSTNIIPGEVVCKFDIRSYDDDARNEAVSRLKEELTIAADREDVDVTFEEVYHTSSSTFSPRIRKAIQRSAQDREYSATEMVSKAGHDAMYMIDVTDAGMVFVPSVDGKSHSEDEFTRWEDVVAGTEVFARTVHELATK